MAIFHLSVQIIGRGTGRSAVAAAAYRAGGRLAESSTGIAYDYTRKAGVIHSDVLLPAGAPDRLGDRERLWNEVEAAERRKDAQLAREIEVALPRELADADAIELARRYVQEQFVARGMIADLSVHKPVGKDGEARPHAHVMLTLREVGPDGFGAKQRAWNSAELLHDWREAAAVRINQALAERGHAERVDHRSYQERGLALEPQTKIGAPRRRDLERGRAAQRAAEHRAIAARNGERLAAEPTIAVEALTEHRPTFTRRDLARFVATHSDGAAQFARVMARVEVSPRLVRLGSDGNGEERFTSAAMWATEQRLRDAAATLAARRTHPVDGARCRRSVADAGLSREQGAAVGHVTRAGGMALVVGYAGTGKSRMLGAARAAWEGEGYRVRGAALSGIAAEGLEQGSRIASRTLASLEHGWGRGRDRLRRGDVLVIDEAGMVGTRQMARVLAHAAAAGAKVVMVGDPEQLQSIQAGGWFRDLVARHGAATLVEVRRQRDGWQREAVVELATARTHAALVRYEAAGMLRAAATHEAARSALIEAWSHDRRAVPARSQIMLAATRQDVRALNDMARERLQRDGQLQGEQMIETARGPWAWAPGDRALFLRNERSLAVKNGTLGTVERLEGQQLTVRLDGPGERRVSFDARDYDQLEHGYATTIHKAQGATVDSTYALLTGHLDRHGTYVALSRHRNATAAFYARDRHASLEQLAQRLGRDGSEATSLALGADQAAGGAMRTRLAGLRAALGRIKEMARGGTRRVPAAEPQRTTVQRPTSPREAAVPPVDRGRQRAPAATRLEQQVALAREAAAQLRQRQAARRDGATREEGPVAGQGAPAARPRLEQRMAGAEATTAQRGPRAAERGDAGRQEARRAEAKPRTARLQQQVDIARCAAARLRQRSRDRSDGLSL